MQGAEFAQWTAAAVFRHLVKFFSRTTNANCQALYVTLVENQ